MAVLDSTIANVALPTLVRAFAISPSASIWIVNAFSLVLVGTVLSLAVLGDRIGYARIYTCGLITFTLGSLICALSGSFGMLIAARVIQGLGAAGIMSVGPALYKTIYPKALLGRGVGISALVVACSSAAGPTIGGLLLHFATWPWLFAVNVPIGIVNCIFARGALPVSITHAKQLDIPSIAMCLTGLPLTLLGTDLIVRHQANTLSITAAIIGVCIIIAFVQRQRTSTTPLVPPELFRIQRFSLAAITSCVCFTAQGLAFVSLPFLFHNILRTDVLQTGLYFSTWPLAIACTAPISGRLSDRYPPPLLSTIGLVLLAIGLAGVATLPEHATPLTVILRNILCGIGFGFFQSPNNRELMGNAPRQYAGTASGILATMRVLGQTIGAASAAIILSSTQHQAGTSQLEVGLRLSLAIAATVSCVAAVLSATRLRFFRRT